MEEPSPEPSCPGGVGPLPLGVEGGHDGGGGAGGVGVVLDGGGGVVGGPGGAWFRSSRCVEAWFGNGDDVKTSQCTQP